MSWLAFFRSSLRGVGIMFTILRCEETVNTKKSFVIRSSGMLRNFREQVAESFKLVNALGLDENLETAILMDMVANGSCQRSADINPSLISIIIASEFTRINHKTAKR